MALDTAIISGASEGIGAAFSKILIKHGWEVIGISRSEKKLNQLKNVLCPGFALLSEVKKKPTKIISRLF